ncbi:MAG: membrane protein [Phycisphaerae bacterium]|jgi:hypothetical protein|nr:MAG: membrane protein [Phycisphaerae bacterium]
MSEKALNKPSRSVRIVGWVLTLVPASLLFVAGVMNIIRPDSIVEQTIKMGYSASVMLPLGIVTVGCVILYLIPRTTCLGAILVTGYLGGAVDVHVRNGDPLPQILLPVVVGVLAWLGLYLREPRIRELFPVRRL